MTSQRHEPRAEAAPAAPLEAPATEAPPTMTTKNTTKAATYTIKRVRAKFGPSDTWWRVQRSRGSVTR